MKDPEDLVKSTSANAFLKPTREQIQTASWFLLLDFSDYLRQYLPDVWTAIKDGDETLDRSDDAANRTARTH